MDEKFYRKYKRVLDTLSNVALCANNELILVGGTALAIFYLKHRISVDIDLVPIKQKPEKMKEALKGCLSKKGYTTLRTRYGNQFVIQFEDTAIKIEIFESPIKSVQTFEFGNVKLMVASLEDLLEMKIETYERRKESRDLYDIIFILRALGKDFGLVKEIITKLGLPKNTEEIRDLIEKEQNYQFFKEVIENVTKTSN